MPSTFDQVQAAKEMFRDLLASLDERVQRQLAPVVRLIQGEFCLEMGAGDMLGSLRVGDAMTVSCPWNGTVFSLRMWLDDGTTMTSVPNPVGGQPAIVTLVTPTTAPSVTITFTLAHRGTPYQRLPLGLTPQVLTGELELVDTVTVEETDVGGGANRPIAGTLPLSDAGLAIDLASGDKLFATITALTGTPHIVGIEFKCSLATVQRDPLPLTP